MYMYEFDTIKRYIEMFDIDDYKSVIIISLFILLLSTRTFIKRRADFYK